MIVLLILVGVTIVTLTGDNGLITKANEAKIATEEAKLKDEVQLAVAEYEADRHTNSQANLENNLRSIFEKMYGTGNITVSKSGKNYKVNVKNSKTTYRVRHTGEVEKYEEMKSTDVYGKINNDTLHLVATNPNPDSNEWTKINETNMCKISNFFDTSNISYVKIDEFIAPLNTASMFRGLNKLIKIENIKKLHTENSTNMSDMFNGCSILEELNLSNFDTSNVTNMKSMFEGCGKIEKLDLSSFDTSNVTSMWRMFGYDYTLNKLDVSGFNTSNVTEMGQMFTSCWKLTELNLTNFDTSNVTGMSQMFLGDISLIKLNVSSFDTKKVTSMYQMFYACKLTELNLSGFDTSNVTNMKEMFNGCSSLTELNLSNFNTLNVSSYDNMLGRVKAKIKLGKKWNSTMTAESTGYIGSQWNT